LKGFLLFIHLVCVGVVQAQGSQVVFDRPGVADSPYLPNSNFGYLESGINLNFPPERLSFSILNCMLRKRIMQKIEGRIGVNCIPASYAISNAFSNSKDIPIYLASKIPLVSREKFAFSTLVSFISPLNFSQNAVEFNTLYQWDLNTRFSFNWNLGMIKSFNHVVYSTSSFCGILNVTNDFSFFLESYNYLSFKLINEYGFDFGMTKIWFAKHQIDLSFLFNSWNNSLNTGISMGYSLKL
jgi:hypothetical protein